MLNFVRIQIKGSSREIEQEFRHPDASTLKKLSNVKARVKKREKNGASYYLFPQNRR